MKKLLFIIPLLIWVSCEDENCECESTDESSSIIGLWEERIWYPDGIEEVLDSDDVSWWFDISAESYTQIISDELYVGFTNWAVGEPNNFNDDEDCAEMWQAGEWNDIACDEERPFIMEIDSLLNDPVLESYFVSVDSLGGSYYYFSTSVASWYDADEMSKSMGGYLVSITSETENDFITILIDGEAAVSIGFYDLGWEGNWRWTSGETDSFCYFLDTIVNDSLHGYPASFDFFGEDSAALAQTYGGGMFGIYSFKAYGDSAYVYLQTDEYPPFLFSKLIRIESYDFTPVCE